MGHSLTGRDRGTVDEGRPQWQQARTFWRTGRSHGIEKQTVSENMSASSPPTAASICRHPFAVQPLSTGKTAPFMKLASDDAAKSATSATSSGSQIRS